MTCNVCNTISLSFHRHYSHRYAIKKLQHNKTNANSKNKWVKPANKLPNKVKSVALARLVHAQS